MPKDYWSAKDEALLRKQYEDILRGDPFVTGSKIESIETVEELAKSQNQKFQESEEIEETEESKNMPRNKMTLAEMEKTREERKERLKKKGIGVSYSHPASFLKHAPDVDAEIAKPNGPIFFTKKVNTSISDDELGEISFNMPEGKAPPKTRATPIESNYMMACVVCGKSINISTEPHLQILAKLNKNGIQADYACKQHADTLTKCEGCCNFVLSVNMLDDGHCLNCINTAHKKYLSQYNEKVEGHLENGVTKRLESQKFASEAARAAFGEQDPAGLVVGSYGVFQKFFGIELEYMSTHPSKYGSSIIRAFKIVKETGIKAKMKRDGTLKLGGIEVGLEVVSAPSDKAYLQGSEWSAFFERMAAYENLFCADYAPPDNNEDPNAKGSGCGYHIHISKDFLIQQEGYGKITNGLGLPAAKVQTFVYHPFNRKFVEIVAGRPSNMFGNFAQNKGLKFAKKDGRITGGAKDVTQIVIDQHHPDHRTAVNFNASSGRTWEFRIFRSTKDRAEFLAKVDFVDAICGFARTGVSSIQQMKDWIYFWDFVSKNKREYQFFYQWMNRNPEFERLLASRDRRPDYGWLEKRSKHCK